MISLGTSSTKGGTHHVATASTLRLLTALPGNHTSSCDKGSVCMELFLLYTINNLH